MFFILGFAIIVSKIYGLTAEPPVHYNQINQDGSFTFGLVFKSVF